MERENHQKRCGGRCCDIQKGNDHLPMAPDRQKRQEQNLQQRQGRMPPEGGGYPTAGDGEALADPAAFPGEGTEMPQQSPIDKPIRNPACRGQYTGRTASNGPADPQDLDSRDVTNAISHSGSLADTCRRSPEQGPRRLRDAARKGRYSRCFLFEVQRSHSLDAIQIRFCRLRSDSLGQNGYLFLKSYNFVTTCFLLYSNSSGKQPP